MKFDEFYFNENNDWRENSVLRTTASGARTHCKIKNLPPDEYAKWRDISLGRVNHIIPDTDHSNRDMGTIDSAPNPHLLRVYYIPPDERRYKCFLRNRPIRCTTNPSLVAHRRLVVVADNVPVAAFRGYRDGKRWKAFRRGAHDELKFDIIGRYEWFRIDFYSYQNHIEFILSDAR